MNQPDLGYKVAELRQQKGMTQEQLADYCEVTVRTIQRIESGEVDPRAHTIAMLSEALDFNFEEDNTQNENLWLVILHLSSIFCFPVIALLLWSWKKTQSFKIDKQGRQVLNFQITMILVLFAALFFLWLIPLVIRMSGASGTESLESGSFMLVVLCAPIPLVLTWIFCAFQGVINATRALADKPIHYPLSIPFVH